MPCVYWCKRSPERCDVPVAHILFLHQPELLPPLGTYIYYPTNRLRKHLQAFQVAFLYMWYFSIALRGYVPSVCVFSSHKLLLLVTKRLIDFFSFSHIYIYTYVTVIKVINIARCTAIGVMRPHWSGPALAQIMACWLTAPSHYLNQCWLIISKVQWHSSEQNFTKATSAISLCN